MTTTIFCELRLAYQRIARRPVPAPWVDQHPTLADYATPADVLTAIRDHHNQPRADATVRAMAELAHRDPDAGTVLIEALVPELLRNFGATVSGDFQTEALTDLALVVLEADDLDQLDDLGRKLGRRGHARARRRLDIETRRRGLETEIAFDIAAHEDLAELATDRAQLHTIRQTVERAISDGELTTAAWEDYCDGRLAPAIGWRRQASRTRTYRARQMVDEVLAHAS